MLIKISIFSYSSQIPNLSFPSWKLENIIPGSNVYKAIYDYSYTYILIKNMYSYIKDILEITIEPEIEFI